MLLRNKVAVVYGAGGAIGGAVARAFAAEGARVHCTGRTEGPLAAVVREIAAAGGHAEEAPVDALDEQAIDAHLRGLVDREGRVDISFNAVGLSGRTVVGVPLVDLDAEQFSQPVASYASSWFLTARLAARRMIPRGSGVIMTVTALPARRGTPLNGGYGPAMAAKEALTRDLSSALAPRGIRVLGLRPQGLPESPMMHELHATKAPSMGGITWEQFQQYLANMSHPKRVLTLAEVASTAAFLASDRASAVMGTTVDLTMGTLDD